MRKDSIAVIGDKDSVLAFKSIGLSVYTANTFEEAEKTLKLLARNYKVIYITEEIATLVPDLIARYTTRAYPIVIPIPSSNGSTGVGMETIKKDVEKAVGANILFN